MGIGLAYCYQCNSHYCIHATGQAQYAAKLQLMAMEQQGMQMQQQAQQQPRALPMPIEKLKPNKKLLLLGK